MMHCTYLSVRCLSVMKAGVQLVQVTHQFDTTTKLTQRGLNLYELHTSLHNQITYSVDSDDDTDFEHLFLLPKLENIWKEHALQAEQTCQT